MLDPTCWQQGNDHQQMALPAPFLTPCSLFQPPVRSNASGRAGARSSSILTQDLSSEDSTDLFGSDAFSAFPGTGLSSPPAVGGQGEQLY